MKTRSLATMITEDDQLMLMIKVLKTPQNEIKLNQLKEVLEKGKELVVDIKQYREKRSLNANSYCWILADKIAEKLKTTKEKVYRQIVKDVGQFEIINIQNNAVDNFTRVWESNGLGWQVEVLAEYKEKGFTDLLAYYGSSVYDTKSMQVLLEELIHQATELGIDTMTPEEQAKLLQMWEDKNGG